MKYSIVFVVVLLCSFYTEAVNWTSSDVCNDLDYVMRLFDEVHPEPWRHTTRDSVMRLKEKLCAELPESAITLKKAVLTVERLLASIHDGHTVVNLSFEELIPDTMRIFPSTVIIEENKIFLIQQRDKITPSSVQEISSINGIPASTLIDSLSHYVSYDTEIWRNYLLSDNFSFLLYLIPGFRNTFTVELNDSLAVSSKTVTLSGLQKKNLNPEINQKQSARRFPIHDSLIAPGILLLSIESMSGNTESWYRKLFSRIAKDSITTLIIDIQNNGGGGDQAWWPLVAHLADSIMTVDSTSEKFDRFKWKIEKPYFSFKQRLRYRFSKRPIHSKKPVTITRMGRYYRLPHVEHPFGGDVFICTGLHTFSSAVNFASVIRKNHLGTIVGNQTGNVPNHCGYTVVVQLPSTHILCRISRRAFYWFPNAADTLGMLPDLPLGNSPINREPDKRDVIQFVLDYINEKSVHQQ